MNFGTPRDLYRIECHETGEIQEFETLAACEAFAANGRKIMPDEPLSFEVTWITERIAEC